MSEVSQSVLITGGTGSFGQAFTRYLLDHNPRRLAILSRGEHRQAEMNTELRSHPNHGCLRFFIGDVRDRQRLQYAMRDISIVVHAAALKVVPTLEYNPSEAIATNVIGSQNVIDASISAGVNRVLLISSDKAVNPVNLYGATKLCAEKLFVAAHNLGGARGPIFSTVRYGNVFGSQGSVVQLFSDLAKRGIPLPITDRSMTRFIITLPRAVSFVSEVISSHMANGSIFVPKLPSASILCLADTIWNKYQNRDLETQDIGIRPGEKIHETLISYDESPHAVDWSTFFSINPKIRSGKHFMYSSDTNPSFLTNDQIGGML